MKVEEAQLEGKRQRRIELQLQKDSKPKRLGKLKYLLNWKEFISVIESL